MKHKYIWKRLICSLLTLVMLLSYVPVPILNAAMASGTCGTDVTWTLDDNGTLTISGSGAMADYTNNSKNLPWYNYKSEIESVIIEDGVTSIGNYAFQNCSNLSDLKIGSGVKSINTYAFSGCSGLTSVVVPDNVIKVGIYAFSQCTNLKSIEFGNAVTEIMGSSFQACTNLETVILNAENCTTISSNAFANCTNLTTVIIGPNVDLVSARFWNLMKSASQLIFQGPNYFSMDAMPSENAFGKILNELPKGNYFADADGVLYQIEDNKATLFYCPPGIETITVPQELPQIGEEGTYPVTTVASHALVAAQELTTVTFESPATIQKLEPLAMAACPTLKSVNGETSATEAKKLFANAQIGANVFYDTGLADSTDGILKKEAITVTTESGPKLSLETTSGVYYTGETCQTTINISNPVNAVEGHIIRVYFQFDDDDGTMNYAVGEHTIKVGTNVYTVRVCETENGMIYYIEIPQPVAGDTISLNVTTSYPSPSSDGGDVVIWGAVLTPEEIANQVDKITVPKEYHESTWQTCADVFPVTKEADSTLTLVADGTKNGNIYVTNLKYTVAIAQQGETLEGIGKDYMQSITYEDILTLPEGVSWREGVLEAIRNGQYSVSSDNYYVTVNGERIQLCTLSGSDKNATRNMWLSLTEDGKNIVLQWKYTNTSATQEMPLVATTLTYGSKVLCVTDPEIASGKTYGPFINDVKAVQHFTHSDDVTKTAQATNSVTTEEADFEIDKSIPSHSGYLGGGYAFQITLKNKTALPYSGLTRVTDPLLTNFYLTSADMQSMFATDVADENATLSILIQNATLCAKVPEGTVMGTDGKEHTVVNETTGVGTQYSGLETEDSVDTELADLLLTCMADGGVLLTVTRKDGTTEKYTIGEGKYYASIEDAFTALHYLITKDTQFTPTWTFVEGFCLWGNQTITYNIPAKAKDSFMMAANDMESYVVGGTISDSNYAYAYYTNADGTEEYKPDSISYNLKCDFTLYKEAEVNGEFADASTNLKAGDVITYALSLSHPGGAGYDALPMVDSLQGGQVLLVPVANNVHLGLEPYSLPEKTIGENAYYVLDKVGEYKNVTVGGLLTDTITVADSDNGLVTLIRWYLTDVKGNYNTVVKYEALVNPDYIKNAGVAYSLDNEVWVGDHQSHRIWDTIGLAGSQLSFDKSIVANKGNLPSEDVLSEYSALEEGMVTTYRFTLTSIGNGSVTVTGNDIYDILPASVNHFWSEANITVHYVAEEGTELSVTNGEHWYVATRGPAGETATNRQYLCWSADFSMNIHGTAYIYVTLQCPGGDVWQNYAKEYGDIRLQNDLVVYGQTDTVYHDLAVVAEAFLQKGVYRTAILPYQSSNYALNTSTNSRLYYANDDAYNRLVFYYVTLYNGGESRLYISDLQDILPKGFTFYGMYSSASSISANASATSTTNSTTFASLSDLDNSSIAWRQATVKAATQMLDSGEQKITFSLVDYSSSTSNDLLYDAVAGKYYLAPGQGVQFAYACRTNDKQDTEDLAKNQVVMPYYNHTDAGITVSENVTVSGQGSSPKRNDGGCELLNNETAQSYGFTGGQADTQWLSSDVTMLRGNIVPGITKAVGGNNPHANILDIINWQVTVTNGGEFPMIDYTVTDVMQMPYQFVDSVSYNIYYNTAKGTTFRTEASLFTISERTQDAITITSDGETESVLPFGETATVPVKIKTYYGSGRNNYNEKTCNVEVSIKKDENGNEVMTLRFPDSDMSIPESGYAVLSVSTKNENVHENRMYYNTAYITPNTQTYDANMVSQGNYTMFNEMSSVRNSCPITVSMGYFTSSEKLVAQVDDAKNAASGSDETNYIILPNPETQFNFTLQVDNTTDRAMENLILIDNLPEENDHSTFTQTDPRYSEFKVSLAEKPNFVVTVTEKNGTKTILTSDQYELKFSNKTEFTVEDWQGKTDWDDTASGTTRSFRVIIRDTASTGTLIPADATVTVTFTAEIDGEWKPGQTAWNSFGYHYNLIGVEAELEAAPLKVGVRLYSIPEMQKQLQLDNGSAFAAEKEETFRFLIYTGNAVTLPDGYTEAQLAQLLTDANRSFTCVELTVAEGQSASDTVMLQDRKCYAYDSVAGVWQETDIAWDWVNASTYTVMELPMEGDSEFVYKSMNGNVLESYTFTYNRAQKAVITCVNQRQSWKAVLHKTDADTGKVLSGAVFGLYSPDVNDTLSDVAYTDLEQQLGFAPRKTITVDDATYYLVQVNTSNAAGRITWTGLVREAYYICELRAPKGYFISVDPQLITFVDYETTPEITVPNRSYYELPSSAGEGIFWYTIGGTLVMLLGAVLCVSMRRKRGT